MKFSKRALTALTAAAFSAALTVAAAPSSSAASGCRYSGGEWGYMKDTSISSETNPLPAC
ncbi:hypothetical protein [Streptomyces hokutonensis]|uniref:hypothetical protein n=1 Tax=Streptomyces hokutonensis TaxID=1306990 RepID=UPI00035CB66D|nr:hypothetical protein [Streptomyces hokutonensis]